MSIKAWCLKITEKVLFYIASEASYVYILSGQKLIKNAKNGQIGDFFWKTEACSGQIGLPDRSVLIGQKLLKNCLREIAMKLVFHQKTLKIWVQFK